MLAFISRILSDLFERKEEGQCVAPWCEKKAVKKVRSLFEISNCGDVLVFYEEFNHPVCGNPKHEAYARRLDEEWGIKPTIVETVAL